MLYHFTEVHSTQTVLRDLYKRGIADLGDGVCARRQTAGRGRLGRSFFSPEGSGLYLSALLPYREETPMTILAAAVSLEVVEAVTGIRLEVEWINDLLLEGKKVAGILAEALTDPTGRPTAVVLGLGLNLYAPPGGFPDALRQRAGALFGDAPLPADEKELLRLKAALAEQLLDGWIHMTRPDKEKSGIALYRSRLTHTRDVPPGFFQDLL